jgi:hypothetical protein
MMDDIRPDDLEEFGVGVSIQRRKLLRVVKRAQKEDVDVSNFSRTDLLSYAKRVREIQRERLKDVKGIDLSFLDRPLLEDLDTDTLASSNDDGSGIFRIFLLAILVAILAIGYQNGHYDNLSAAIFKKFESVSSPKDSTPSPTPTTYRKPSPPSPVKKKTTNPSSSSSSSLSSSRKTAQKCFSIAHSASKWKHNYKYPKDIEEHYEKLLDVTQPYRIQPFHDYAGYAGPWIENHWIFTFMGRPLSDFGPYVFFFFHLKFDSPYQQQQQIPQICSDLCTMDRYSNMGKPIIPRNRKCSSKGSQT